jgi:hypothetical protein
MRGIDASVLRGAALGLSGELGDKRVEPRKLLWRLRDRHTPRLADSLDCLIRLEPAFDE